VLTFQLIVCRTYHYLKKIGSIIEEHNFDASKIELEITESALMDDFSRASKIIDRLSNIGLKFAIDDFGTGFSSLNYLKKLPAKTLKIDKSFVFDMCNNVSDKAIVKTIIELGHNFNCRVVAEGVENKATLDALNSLNVDAIQGFFYSKPLPADELLGWLIDYNEHFLDKQKTLFSNS